MNLLELVAAQVPRAIRNRGSEYIRRGAVRLVRKEDTHLVAEVQGLSLYKVEIEASDDCLLYECTCPYYSDRWSPCKHLWATLLLAQDLNVLPDVNGTAAPVLESKDEFLLSKDDEDSTHEPAGVRTHGDPDGWRTLTRPPRLPAWKTRLEALRWSHPETRSEMHWPGDRELLYVFGIDSGRFSSGLWIDLRSRDRKKSGEWGKVRSQSVTPATIPAMPSEADRQILQMLLGTPRYPQESAPAGRFYPSESALHSLLPLICATGRGLLDANEYQANMLPLEWDPGPPWIFSVRIRRDQPSARYVISGALRRGDEQIDLAEPTVLLRAGFVVLSGRIGPLEDNGCFSWIGLLRTDKSIEVPAEDNEALLEELLRFQSLPMLELPEDLRFEEVVIPAKPRLKIRAPAKGDDRDSLRAELYFDYQGCEISPATQGAVIPDPANRRRILRDLNSEKAAREALGRAGFRPQLYYLSSPQWSIPAAMLPRAVRDLISAGWYVEAHGKPFRTPGTFKIEVSSGIDWFELRGCVEFGDGVAPLPSLLAALRRRESIVQLDNGDIGILPEEWLRRFGILSGLGAPEGDHLRFSRSQTALLEALLAAEPEVSCDEVFEKARARLRDFAGVSPSDASQGFTGLLREYQREGLGWLHFLREFGFGGCLADDMGLGKTVQVLALLESRRSCLESAEGTERVPSLVVVPRSLIFNWKQEAERFAPRLKILDHTGAGRSRDGTEFDSCDVVLTTYGTMRRDAALLKGKEFDYLILDEAQAIKNADSASAKAARLLKGRHRLALSGTPVENHLGELWSLFDFLNPGMLGSARASRAGQVNFRDPGADTLALLAKALRPFILRRTKDQVARDLPEKTEQTLVCELDRPQRQLYDELRDHYRRQLTRQVERDGISKSKIRILEALLRLRQAALHPGLVDASRSKESSAKLEVLLPQLEEVLEEGHKALVFSQFTSMLSILRENLDRKGIRYVYLDGRTRNRAAVVETFQTDPDCRLFLISLKAGGLGLNLTAAEYVFLLDPWWNPAVEAQAIDRTHRIGQKRPVFAYRLIAGDTVEEKVLELQKTKRELADAIVNADNSLIRNLRPEDLALLLS